MTNMQPVTIDLVHTPFVNYIVISYTDPNGRGEPGIGFNFSGDFPFYASDPQGELKTHIEHIVKKHPDTPIQAENNISHLLDMPSATLGELVSDEILSASAQTYHEAQLAFSDRINKLSNVRGNETPSPEQCYETVKSEFEYAAWNQLVRRASSHFMQFDHEVPPNMLIYDESNRGFAIVDATVNSNNGYGVGQVYFYEILSVNDSQPTQDGVFLKQQVTARYVLDTSMQFLPGSAYSKIDELKTRGRVVTLDGSAAFIELDPNQSRVLEQSQIVLESTNPR